MDKEIINALKKMGIDPGLVKDVKLINLDQLVKMSVSSKNQLAHSITVRRRIGWKFKIVSSRRIEIKDGDCRDYGFYKPFAMRKTTFGVEFVTSPYKSCVIGLGWFCISITPPRYADCFIIEDASPISKQFISQISKEFFHEYDKRRRVESFTRRMLRTKFHHSSYLGRFCFHWKLESRKWRRQLRAIKRNARMLSCCFFRVR